MTLPPIPGIYMIRNNTRNRIYVGSSRDVRRRCQSHVAALVKGHHPVASLQRDWQQDGPSAFVFGLLDPVFADDARLGRAERRWQERMKEIGIALYGIAIGGRARSGAELPGLRAIRYDASLSQEELGRLAGVQRFTVTRLENGGEARPSTVRKLADALGCTPKDLLEPS